jgi:chorismate--pyruvate lyase
VNNFFVEEPVWRTVDQCDLNSMSSKVVSWLLESNSLTTRIKKTFKEPFRVDVIGENWAQPFITDMQCLGGAQPAQALIREVVLYVGNRAVVFARTTLPKQVADELQELTRLGNQPLGEVIFSYPDLQRVGLDITEVDLASLNQAMQVQLKAETHVWGRRNTYQIHKRSFLVEEFFFPELYTA